MSGYRPLNKTKKTDDENVTCETVLDQFLKPARRKDDPEIPLWDWAKEYNCKTKCKKDHIPVFTGGPVKQIWPLSEDCCKLNLMIFSNVEWEKPEYLMEGYEIYSEAFAAFLDSEECYHALSLFDGGEGFNWHQYAVDSLGFQWDDTVSTWLEGISKETEKSSFQYLDETNLPEINLLCVTPLQRLIIALNIEKLLEFARKETHDFKPLRLLVQGTAGTGKTFVIKALTYIARRIFKRNGAVMNLALTGSASNLLPDGRTVHSTLPPLSKLKKKDLASAQMTDYPMTCKELKKLRQIIGHDSESEEHKLSMLNMDERSIFSHRLLAWSSQRLCEATGEYGQTFGSVPVVNFFGDLGQLGPVDARGPACRTWKIISS